MGASMKPQKIELTATDAAAETAFEAFAKAAGCERADAARSMLAIAGAALAQSVGLERAAEELAGSARAFIHLQATVQGAPIN